MDDSRIRYRVFGQRIQNARLVLGLSRKEVAEYIGVQPTFYRRVERGIALLAIQTFASLWRRLQFDTDAVLDALPVEIKEPSKRSRQSPRSRLELVGQHAGFGRIISRARIDAHITQQTLADTIGVQRRHISAIESGHNLPSLTRFAQLRRVLKLDVPRLLSSLLGDDGPSEPFSGFGDAVQVS
jgi:transcriptional regulator with XRE-family HTH domain